MAKSKWIRADVKFQDRGAILVISDRELLTVSNGSRLDPRELLSDPEMIENVVYDIIAENRTDLDGGILIGIEYNYLARQLELLYLHRSLPKLSSGDIPLKQPLLLHSLPTRNYEPLTTFPTQLQERRY